MAEPPVVVSSSDVQAQPRKTGIPHLDLVIALLAILMSAISLGVAFQNGRTERGLLAASTWPYLGEIVSNDYNGGRDVAIGVVNGGVGPAKLKTLEVFFDGKPVTSPLDLLRKCCGLEQNEQAARRQLPKGFEMSIADETVLRPGDQNVILAVHRVDGANEIADRFAGSLLKVGFRACYCSVLDECWISDLKSTRTKPVESCAAPAVPFDPNGR
jgi:hypothetical protein